MIFTVLRIILFAVMVPILIGIPFESYISKSEGNVSACRSILFGYVIYCTSFQLIAPLFIIRHASFNSLLCVWSMIICVILIASIFYAYRYREAIFSELKTLSVKSLISGKDWFELLVMAGAIGIVFVNVFIPGYFMHFDTDDARFVAEAMEAYERNTLLMYHPITGEFLGGPIGEMLKDVWAPYPIFLAVVARLTGLVLTVSTHTLLPLIFVPLCYMAFYVIAKHLFSDDTKSIWISIFLFGFINIFSMETLCSFGWTLLAIVWQGRSFFCVVLLPVLWYQLIRFITDESFDIKDYLILMITEVACCMPSGMGTMLVPLIVAAHAFVLLVIKRKIREPLYIMASSLPTLVYFVLYAIR